MLKQLLPQLPLDLTGRITGKPEVISRRTDLRHSILLLATS